MKNIILKETKSALFEVFSYLQEIISTKLLFFVSVYAQFAQFITVLLVRAGNFSVFDLFQLHQRAT